MGSTRPRAPASRDRSGFAHHDRKEVVIFKLGHYPKSAVGQTIADPEVAASFR
jgi:hypothetical protein